MTDLKAILFRETYEAFETLRREKRLFPDVEHGLSLRTFCTLWGVIEAAMLEGDYEEWRVKTHGRNL